MYATLFHVNSITYAMRGKSILEQNGIRATVERSTQKTARNGCGYALIVSKGADRAKQILQQNGVPIRQVTGYENP